MIDKSIRQHYQDGENVDPYTGGKKTIWDPIKQKYFPQDKTGLDERQLLKNVAGSAVKNLATRKLAAQIGGTGILSSLGPIGMIIAMMLARKGVKYAKGKIPKDIGQALTQGFTGLGVSSPEEQKELRKLEKSRAWMLNRKDKGKGYSKKKLDIVTRAIAEAKGLDINNPNDMKNIDKPITQIQIEKPVTEPRVIPETPEVISPHLDDIITKPTVAGPFKYLQPTELVDKPTTTDRPIGMPEHLTYTAPKKPAPVTVHSPHRDPADKPDPPSRSAPTGVGNPFGYKKGGRVDKALDGRSRDI